MKEYKVIEGISITELEQQINEYLKKNWKLQGGVSITYNRGTGRHEMFYVQAIVK
ncbi:DUF1737 domain-containing protein [Flavobacterium lacisediminis]|uniref:DUF1737 domain-containing protein n=1 Tax=Flavobacterium lacisediminis TaxID=2989705 RepID=A0ABT3EKS9_9FLAO|nr:DUF1737 domain-containing protein [Flavobacterium lacisediminis]MCW1149171.1 DUF1737 domain-containing protein [Flavobacterium lacisediminis]